MPFKHPGFGTVSDASIAARNKKIKNLKCDICGGTGGHVDETTDEKGYSYGDVLCDHCGADFSDQEAARAGF